ncbi:Serine/threonine-protein kinase zyg-8 [Trichostrongylus colubriformis]|uniref:Serine/threonine-protein kinase zyg-8 n=1 Tax=Trichostrongylus colubriformis TaxID=6319 RepID=A0AAN8FJG2_TRICO
MPPSTLKGHDDDMRCFQTASALAYLHCRKIVHRDVKPENLLLDSKKRVQLCDFGLACTVLGPLYRVCGTPTYCAPEILKETGYGFAVDVWSLGVLLHVMLVGFAPFRSTDRTRLFRLITQGKLHLDLPEWKEISSSTKLIVNTNEISFIKSTLQETEICGAMLMTEG